MRKKKRRVLLIDHKVQWAIARQAVLHWIGFTLAAVTLLGLQFLVAGLLRPWNEQWPTICRVATAMFMSLMLLLPMFIYDSFQLSNRLVGPVKRLRRVLRELAAGKPFSPVKFRKGDYWQEMADELQLAVEALRKQRSAEEPAAAGRIQDTRVENQEIVAR